MKRIYEEPSADDGTRVLVDRLWARGVTKDRAQISLWAKDVAPSTELRKWYDHDPERFGEFEACYRRELETGTGQAALREVLDSVTGDTLTLLTAVKEIEISHLAVLQKVLREISAR